MTVRYHVRGTRAIPEYVCQRVAIAHGGFPCQRVPGAGTDKAIGELLVEAVTPLALGVALSVQEELNQRAEEADQLRRQQVERACYDAECGGVTCRWIPTTAWWPMPWKPTGTKDSALSPTRKGKRLFFMGSSS